MFVATKLPQGLEITHAGRTIRLKGANDGITQDMIHRNDRFGVTELKGEDEAAFNAWVGAVTYKDGKGGEKLAEPFAAIENGLIVGGFKSEADARAEMGVLAGMLETGTAGIDPKTDKQMKAAGLETADKKD